MKTQTKTKASAMGALAVGAAAASTFASESNATRSERTGPHVAARRALVRDGGGDRRGARLAIPRRMPTRNVILWALPALVCACVPGTTYLGFTTGVANAPPPPHAVVVEPAVTLAPGTSVYVVSEPSVPYDMFRFGTTWYVYSGGYWYRSASYRGPFAVVDVRYVPREVVTLPPGHWKHHPHGGPPGHRKKRGRA